MKFLLENDKEKSILLDKEIEKIAKKFIIRYNYDTLGIKENIDLIHNKIRHQEFHKDSSNTDSLQKEVLTYLNYIARFDNFIEDCRAETEFNNLLYKYNHKREGFKIIKIIKYILFSLGLGCLVFFIVFSIRNIYNPDDSILLGLLVGIFVFICSLYEFVKSELYSLRMGNNKNRLMSSK